MGVPLYLIFGADEYLVSAKAKEVVQALVPPDDQALGLETIDGGARHADEAVAAIHACREAVQTMGFFGAQKVVWLRDASFLTDNRIGKTDRVKSTLADLTKAIKAGLPAETILVVSAPGVDKRYAFYKACKAAGECHEFAVSDKAWENEKLARTRAQEAAHKAGLTLSGPVLDMFLTKVGTETRQIVNEIQKLALYVGDRQQVTQDDIHAICCSSREALAWDLADAVGERRLDRALHILRQLIFQKESPLGLVIALGNRVRELLVYRQALDAGWLVTGAGRYGPSTKWGDVPPTVDRMLSEDFARDPRATHPFRIGVLAGQAKRFSLPHLRQCQRQILNTHAQLVSSRMAPGVALEFLLIKMLG